MDFFEVINKRYSYRGEFKKDKLPKEDIEAILNAALAAPTAMHVNTTSYIAITDKAIISKIGNIIKRNGSKSAPFILVLLSEDKSEKTKINFEIENYSCACQNILLAITALNYETVWTDGILRTKEINDSIRKLLNIEDNKTIRAVLPIGRALNPQPPKEKEKIEDCVVFI